jgi:Hint-domain
MTPCKEVYNIILDSIHQVNINGIECVTLGHLKKGENVEHPYFGSSKVISDLLRKKI